MFRLTARGMVERPRIERAALGGSDPGAAQIGKRDIFVEAEGGFAPADIYDFEKLAPGNVVAGPAVIHTPITTIVRPGRPVRPGGRLPQHLHRARLRPAMDPITFSIIRHRLFRVIDEAVITLKHVSGSAITNEGHDLMVSLYRADGSLLMGGVGFLHHLTSAAEACKAVIRRFEGDIGEGDVFPHQLPLHRGTPHLRHLPRGADPP